MKLKKNKTKKQTPKQKPNDSKILQRKVFIPLPQKLAVRSMHTLDE